MRNLKKRIVSAGLALTLALTSVVPAYSSEAVDPGQSAVGDVNVTAAPADEGEALDNGAAAGLEETEAPVTGTEGVAETDGDNSETVPPAESEPASESENGSEPAGETEEEAYIVYLPELEGVSYTYDEEAYDAELSGDDYGILIYNAGDTVKLGVDSDMECMLVDAESGDVFKDIVDGKVKFEMPAADLFVQFVYADVQQEAAPVQETQAETAAPATETPATEAPETEAPETEAAETETETATDVMTEAVEETETETATEAMTEAVVETETETATEAMTEVAEETEAMTEAETIAETEEESILGQGEVVTTAELEEDDAQATYLYANAEYVWSGDYQFNPAEFVSDSWYDSATEDLSYESGSVDLSAIGVENEVVYRITSKVNADEFYFLIVPYVPVADKDAATIRLDEIRNYIDELKNTDGFSGVIPAMSGVTLDGGEITVVKGSEVVDDFYSLGYDTDRFAVQIDLDKSDAIDYNTAGDYKAVFHVSAYENADYYWYITVTVHVVEALAENPGVTVILDTMGLTGKITTEDGSVNDIFYGKVFNTESAITDIVLAKNFGKSLNPEITLQVNGEDADADSYVEVVESDDETFHAVVSGLDASANDYTFHIGFDGWDPLEGGAFKAGGGWKAGDDMYSEEDYLRDMQEAGLFDEDGKAIEGVTGADFEAAMEALNNDSDAGNGIMPIASTNSKTWTFYTSSATVTGSARCWDHGDTVANAMTISIAGKKSDITKWLSGIGLKIDDKDFPSSINVNCTDHGAAGWHPGSQGLNCSLTVTASSTKATFALTAHNSAGTSGYQSFYGSRQVGVDEKEGYLCIRKSSEGIGMGFLGSTPLLSLQTQFNVYSDKACEKRVAKMAITDIADEDDDGDTKYVQKKISLEEGTYYVKEVKQADGHRVDTYVRKVEVKANKTTYVHDNWSSFTKRWVNRPYRYEGELLSKVDADNPSVPVAGAIFRVEYWTNQATVAGAEKLYTWFFQTDAEGKILYDEAHKVASFGGVNSDNLIYIAENEPALPIGWLYFTEVQTPEHYLVSNISIGPVHLAEPSDNTQLDIDYYPVEATNKKITGPIEVQKYVAGTGFSVNKLTEEYTFEGAQYTVYSDAGCTQPVTTITLNRDGYGKSTDVLEGQYWVKETKAPTSNVFIVNNTAYPVTVTSNPQHTGTLQALVLTEDNTVPYTLNISKSIEEMDGMSEAELNELYESGILAKVRFSLTHENVANLGAIGYMEVQCDKYGKASVDLFAGKWTIAEISTPDTYHRVMDPVVIVEDGSKPTYEFGNVNKTYDAWLRFIKKDAVTKNPIPGVFDHAKIKLYKADLYGNFDMSSPLSLKVQGMDEPTTEFETSDEGYVFFDGALDGGKYMVVETDPPIGYEALASGVVFEITKDATSTDPITVEIPDPPVYGQLLVTKHDAETGEVLGAGYKFEVVVDGDILDGSGAVVPGFEDGTVVDTITTGEDGIAKSRDDLRAGNYIVREVAVPGDGHFLSDEVYKAVIPKEANNNKPYVIPVDAKNKEIKLRIFKTDSMTGAVLKGVKFRIKLKDAEDDDSQIYVTDENGELTAKGLSAGDYTIQEIETIPGYNLNDKVFEFTVKTGDGLIDCGENTKDTKDEDGNSTGVYVITEDSNEVLYGLDVVNQPNVVHITKRDITNSEEVPGATLRITDADGMVWDEWVSTEEPHEVLGLYAGTYTLTEVLPPEYYELASSIQFTVEDTLEVQEVEMFDKPYRDVEISKKDITNGEELPGAHLVLKNEAGETVDEWVSTAEPHMVKLHSGKYTLTETLPPDLYELAESVSFEVLERGEGDFEVQHVEMFDKPYRDVEVSKKDITNGEELPGAHLVIKDETGNTVEEWDSTTEPHMVKLHSGKYTLTETLPPDLYELSETIEFEVLERGVGDFDIQHVEMFDKPYREVEVSKKDITNEEEIPDAHLAIYDENGDVVEEWVSEEEPHMVRLHSGKYTLTERKPADGYVTAEEIEFEVLERGEGDFDIQHVEMFDDVTKVEISKQDVTNEKELPGARLVIKDEDGKKMEEWTSTNEPHYIEMLPIGKYTLTEVTAPDGYDVAETVEFEVMDTAEIQHVVMYDSPKPEVVPAPQTGDDFDVMPLVVIIVVIVVLIAAAAVLVTKGKSKKAESKDEPKEDKTE